MRFHALQIDHFDTRVGRRRCQEASNHHHIPYSRVLERTWKIAKIVSFRRWVGWAFLFVRIFPCHHRAKLWPIEEDNSPLITLKTLSRVGDGHLWLLRSECTHQIYDMKRLGALDVPEPNCAIGAAGDQRTLADLNAPHGFPVTLICSQALVRVRVPGLANHHHRKIRMQTRV